MKIFILIIALFTLPVTSYAAGNRYGQSRDHRDHHNNHNFWNKVDHRLDRQLHRIEQGLQTGELTRREAKRLYRQHNKLDRRINRVRRKRWVDHYDQSNVMECLNEASDSIYHYKHNNRYARTNNHRHHRHHIQHNQGYGHNRRYIRSNSGYSTGIYFRF